MSSTTIDIETEVNNLSSEVRNLKNKVEQLEEENKLIKQGLIHDTYRTIFMELMRTGARHAQLTEEEATTLAVQSVHEYRAEKRKKKQRSAS